MSTIEKTLDMFDMWIMLSRKKSGYINEMYNELVNIAGYDV
jgi:hypothetical protein